MGRIWSNLVEEIDNLTVRQKIYSMAGLFALIICLQFAVAVYSVRLQSDYRDDLATAARATNYIERVNGLIYAIVMESRGIYMSVERSVVKRYGDELLKRSTELADVVDEWAKTVRDDDAEEFAVLRQRIEQFIKFRRELVRLAVNVSQAAGREWGDNDANRSVRTSLNQDLEALARIYAKRTEQVARLDEQGYLVSWYLILLGVAAIGLTGVVIFGTERIITAPLNDIARTTERIVAGKLKLVIPHVRRRDEIGDVARAVWNFQEAMMRNLELQQLELATAKQRDAALGERDDLSEKYLAKKWQLDAAINNMAQGLIMTDAKGNVLVTNRAYRDMYRLTAEVAAPGRSLKDIVVHRARVGLFAGDIDEYVSAILDRIAGRKPCVAEIELADGRIVRVSERSMDGGGWVATHEDCTERCRTQLRLQRTERLLLTVLENMPEAIIAKDARTLQYVFVNRATERLYGIGRSDMIGKTAREIFSPETAQAIERHDRQLLAGDREPEEGTYTIETPGNGRRTISVRRLPIADDNGEARYLLNMVCDRSDQLQAAA